MDCQRKSMPWIDRSVNWKHLLAFLLPDRCHVCDAAGIEGAYCERCADALPRHASQCRVCGAPLAEAAACGKCQRDPPPILETVAPFRYAPPVSEAIHKLKYHRALACGRDLGLLLARELTRDSPRRPDALVPVPLHWRRRFRRGFNQSLEIAEPVSRRLDIPIRCDLVRRRAHTTPQVGLRPGQRRRNVRGAFRTAGPEAPGRVAIVDDVVTSGSTAEELARCLRRAGAREVYLWALARV